MNRWNLLRNLWKVFRASVWKAFRCSTEQMVAEKEYLKCILTYLLYCLSILLNKMHFQWIKSFLKKLFLADGKSIKAFSLCILWDVSTLFPPPLVYASAPDISDAPFVQCPFHPRKESYQMIKIKFMHFANDFFPSCRILK